MQNMIALPCRDKEAWIHFPREKYDSEYDEDNGQNEGKESGAT
jgi:hypothetical protein